MTRSRARNTAWALTLTVFCGCQSPKWLQSWAAPSSDGGFQTASHSEPKSVPGLFAGPKDDVQKLLKKATEYDNANRSNPHDRESLRAARLAYERILELQPSHAYALHRLGTIADREGQFPEAERAYLAAQKLNPNSPEIYSDLGYSYLLQNRLVESEQALQRALELNPQQPRARVNLGIVMARAGQLDQAFEHIKSERGEAEARAILAQQTRNVEPAMAPITAPMGQRNQFSQPPTAPVVTHQADDLPPNVQMNEATRSLREAILRQRAIEGDKAQISRQQAAAINASPSNPMALKAARERADGQAAAEMNQQMSDIDRDDYRALQAARTRIAAAPAVDPRGAPGQIGMPDQRGYDPRYQEQQYPAPNHQAQPTGYPAQPRNLSTQSQYQQNSQPIYAEPPRTYNNVQSTGMTRAAPADNAPLGQMTSDGANAPSNAWERARQQAARMGFEAGGGSLFPTDEAEAQAAPATLPGQNSASRPAPGGYDQSAMSLPPNGQNYPSARGGVSPVYGNGDPRMTGTPIGMDVGSRAPAGMGMNGAADNGAEVELMQDQIRQLQEQIARSRSRLPPAQGQGRPQVEFLPPSSE